MHIKKAICVLERRKAFIKGLAGTLDNFMVAELAAIDSAIHCMELCLSYGYAVVSERGPLLPSQLVQPDHWTSADVHRMRQAVIKNERKFS